ncbi:hypothetical protein [Pseudohaliea sp.]|uniref:hypothetical protein n=1 Tax=Pseudohaliea sp. TaxID=2740289 RepID=UPI0032EE7DB3
MAPATRQLPPLVPGLLAGALSAPAGAQLPLTIEALLVSEHRLTATLGSSRGSHREPALRPGPQGPTLAWHELTVEQSSLGLRYGLTPRLELNARYERSSLRRELDGQFTATGTGERLVLGANWLAARGVAGSLLLDARVAALGRPLGSGDGWQRATRGSLGATWYRPLDPVVLSLAARYQREAPVAGAAGRRRPGALFSADAAVNFAVNDRVTLIGGFGLSRREPDRIARRAIGGTRLRSSVDLGLAVGPWAGGTLFLRGRLPLGAAESGGALSLELLQTF